MDSLGDLYIDLYLESYLSRTS